MYSADSQKGEVHGFPPYLVERANEVGLKPKNLPSIPYSRPVLEVTEYAKEQVEFSQYQLDVFKLYREEAKNIGLRGVIREISREGGLDADEAKHCLDKSKFTQLVITQSEKAKRIGIIDIPTYYHLWETLIQNHQSALPRTGLTPWRSTHARRTTLQSHSG